MFSLAQPVHYLSGHYHGDGFTQGFGSVQLVEAEDLTFARVDSSLWHKPWNITEI